MYLAEWTVGFHSLKLEKKHGIPAQRRMPLIQTPREMLEILHNYCMIDATDGSQTSTYMNDVSWWLHGSIQEGEEERDCVQYVFGLSSCHFRKCGINMVEKIFNTIQINMFDVLIQYVLDRKYGKLCNQSFCSEMSSVATWSKDITSMLMSSLIVISPALATTTRLGLMQRKGTSRCAPPTLVQLRRKGNRSSSCNHSQKPVLGRVWSLTETRYNLCNPIWVLLYSFGVLHIWRGNVAFPANISFILWYFCFC
jgi:hypothetical protein